tara:strand:+ start:332 stop:502 length:171 start_codon:yes stop_codon:yes gene_type:complete
MIDAVVLISIMWIALVGLVSFFFFDEGTKGVEKDPYYGRKTGTIYTAKKERSDYLL